MPFDVAANALGKDLTKMVVLADEIFTPSSSRFRILADYEVGISPKSNDKQFLRSSMCKYIGAYPFPERMESYFSEALNETIN